METRKDKGHAWNTHSTPSPVAEVAEAVNVYNLVLNHLADWKHGEDGNPHDWDDIARPVIEERFEGELIVGEDLIK